MPKVSVIIPTYNTAKYIAAAIDSVLRQTYQDFEIIVINDGSPDTPELEIVLQPYFDKIRYVRQDNTGPSGARNLGISVAHGELVAFLDSDDLWEPNYLEVQVAAFEDDPDLAVLYPNGIVFDDSGSINYDAMKLSPSVGPVTFESLVNEKCVVLMFVTARRSALERAGLFDVNVRSSEDFDLWLRVVKSGGRIAYHNAKLVRHRVHVTSLSADPVWMCQNALKVVDKAEATLLLNADERRALAQAKRRFTAKLELCEGKAAFRRGDFSVAVAKLKASNSFYNSRKLAMVIAGLHVAPRLLRRIRAFRDRSGPSLSVRV